MDTTQAQIKALYLIAMAAYVKAIGLEYNSYLDLLRRMEPEIPPTDPAEAWFRLESAMIEAGLETR